MAKTIKATKSKFLLLNRLLAKLPEPKNVEDSLKLMSFFRNVKKALRKTLDEISDIQKVRTKKIEKETKEYMEILPALQSLEREKNRTEKQEAEFAELKAKIKDIDAEAAKKVKEEESRLKEIEEGMNSTQTAVDFDHESFNYIEALFKNTPTVFKAPNDSLDLDTMSDVLSMFEEAVVSTK